MPKFSIIIPTYNRSWCLSRAIDSVFKQSFSDWELIIVDDGSTDNTREIINPYASDARLRYFKKENGGVGSARNFGINKACGKYIVFLDSDDELVKEALDLFKKSIHKFPHISFFIFGALDQNRQKTYFMKEDVKEMSYAEYISEKYAQGEMIQVYSRSIFENKDLRFNETFRSYGGESFFYLNIAKYHHPLAINKIVRIYHVGSDDLSIVNSSISIKKVNDAYLTGLTTLNIFGNDLKKYNKTRFGRMNLALARMCVLLKKRGESFKYFFAGIRTTPFDTKRILLYLISFLDRNLWINNLLILLDKRSYAARGNIKK